MRSWLPKLGLFLFLSNAFATTYYVTQSGGGSHNGTSLGNSWSLVNFNATSVPRGGDTVLFTGNFTATIVPACNGSGNGAGRLTLNFRGATLNNSAYTRLQLTTRSYLTVLGGSLGGAYDGAIINFNPNSYGQSHDITLDGWTYNGSANGVAIFLSLNHVYNLTVSNCTVTNVSNFVCGDSTLNHDIDITGCSAATSTDTTQQDDLIHLGDAANITIERSKLVGRAPAAPVGNHNDVIQNYTKGGAYPGNPTNWVIRYNWIEMQQTSGSGDASWLMFQSMNGSPALKVYCNVFVGTGTIGNNGILISRNVGGSYYLYNNTIVRHGNPGNDVRFLDSGTLYAKNNVGSADFPVGNFVSWLMGKGGAWDYNFFYRASAPANYAGPHGSVSVDPRFTNSAGNNFSLLSTSPLRGKGDSSIGAEYNQALAPGASWPNPALVTRSSPWNVGAY